MFFLRRVFNMSMYNTADLYFLSRSARTIISQIRREITTFLQYGWRFMTLTTDKVVSYRILPFSDHITKKVKKHITINSENIKKSQKSIVKGEAELVADKFDGFWSEDFRTRRNTHFF